MIPLQYKTHCNTMKQETTRWEATAIPGLYVRQPGGGFYARITLDGKRSWRWCAMAILGNGQEAASRPSDGFVRHERATATLGSSGRNPMRFFLGYFRIVMILQGCSSFLRRKADPHHPTLPVVRWLGRFCGLSAVCWRSPSASRRGTATVSGPRPK